MVLNPEIKRSFLVTWQCAGTVPRSLTAAGMAPHCGQDQFWGLSSSHCTPGCPGALLAFFKGRQVRPVQDHQGTMPGSSKDVI